jgi:hypothetical protein
MFAALVDPVARRAPERSGPWRMFPWVLPVIVVLLSRLQVGDLAYQLRAGNIMWETMSVLRADSFTYTIPGAPWLDQQWGAQVVLGRWFTLFSWRGLMALQAAIVACSFGVTYRRTVASGVSVLIASAVTLIAFAAAASLPGALALRPQLLALPLFIASGWIISQRHDRPALQLALLPIGIVWSNTHGSFLLLTVLLAIAFASDLIARSVRTKATGALLIASLFTPLISPWGVEIYRYVWDLARSPIVREAISEWRPLYTQPAAAVIVGLAAVGACIGFARRAARRPTFEEAAMLTMFTVLAVWSGRNLLWWAVVVPPIVGGLLAGWRAGGDWSSSATRGIALALSVVVIVGTWRIATTPDEQLRTEAPPGITAWLANHQREGRVFAEWWGGWFEFAVPQLPMFVDARVELFPSSVWRDYAAIVDMDPTWSTVLDRWHITTIVLARNHHAAFEQALRTDPLWTLAYEDGDGFVFTRLPG